MAYSNPEKKVEYNREYRKTHPELLQYMRDWRKANPDRIKNIDLKKRYGITLDDYRRMLVKQSDACAICKQPEFIVDRRTGKVRSLAVDHNHKTGQIRGLLCTNCNKAIGHLKDDSKLVQACLEYVTKHGSGA